MYDPLAGVTTLTLWVWVVTPAIGSYTPPRTYPSVFLILILIAEALLLGLRAARSSLASGSTHSVKTHAALQVLSQLWQTPVFHPGR